VTTVTEIAPDIFRLCTYIKPYDLQFSQFLIRDEEPLLFHTGLNMIFPEVIAAAESVFDPTTLRWIAFSHYEADECGALNKWLTVAPQSTAACSIVGKGVSVDDVSVRPARGLADGEMLSTGRYRLRFLQTPHVPHGWDAGLMYEEVTGTLLCSDIGTHHGDREPVIEVGIADRTRDGISRYVGGPMDHAHPYTARAAGVLARLADLKPRTLATMHGSTYQGDGQQALMEIAQVWKETLTPAGMRV